MSWVRQRLRQILLAFGALVLIAGVTVAALAYALIFRDLPQIESLSDYHPKLITHILDRDGALVGTLAEEHRIVVPIEQIPSFVIDAFVSAEDEDFYNHKGLDYMAILRATIVNLRAGRVKQGGSTISQQVAKTFLLTSERSFVRKIKDMVLARRIERALAKNEILYLYLNQIFLGSRAYGIEAAARSYFNKSVAELTLAEAAMIAGVVPRPSRWNPRASMEQAKKRQQFVLGQMLKNGRIEQDEFEAALEEEVEVFREPRSETDQAVAFFREEIRRYLVARYGEDVVKTAGLEVTTSMDLEAQLAAHRAVRNGLRNHDRRRGFRGPIQLAGDEAEWPALLEEIEAHNAEIVEQRGSVVQGLVVALDDEAETAQVKLGTERETTLTFEDVKWAHDPDPNWDGINPKLKRISQALKLGYQIRLERLDDPVEAPVLDDGEAAEASDEPLPEPRYGLFQAPLAEGALFAMDIESGWIQAITGGYRFGTNNQFDRAVQMTRQPGSAFKPIVYTAALEKGYTPATIVYDTPVVYTDSDGFTWKPGNYSEKFYGAMTLKTALAKSRNLATIKVLRDIGISSVIETARALGIDRDFEQNLSLGLGSGEVTLAELVQAYAVFAAGGRRVEPVLILEVRDRDGELLEQNVTLRSALELIETGESEGNGPPDLTDPDIREALIEELMERVDSADDPNAPPPGYAIDPVTAFLMADMLQSVVTDGTGFRARRLKHPTGGKTGTTNDLKDAWYVGFTPRFVAGAWVGYDEARNLGKNEAGSRAASPIFVDYAEGIIARQPRESFRPPETGVVYARIDAQSGKLACPGDGQALFQAFREGTTPEDVASCGSSVNGGSVGTPVRLD